MQKHPQPANHCTTNMHFAFVNPPGALSLVPSTLQTLGRRLPLRASTWSSATGAVGSTSKHVCSHPACPTGTLFVHRRLVCSGCTLSTCCAAGRCAGRKCDVPVTGQHNAVCPHPCAVACADAGRHPGGSWTVAGVVASTGSMGSIFGPWPVGMFR
jgi:hypothetical protein